jgi:predicted metalloprotease with PDZ domain
MLKGELIVLPGDIGAGRVLIRSDKEVFELGFELEHSGSSKISNTVPMSRAAAAGVRDGDRVIAMSGESQLLSKFDSRMDLKVQRGNEKIDISYWPRSRNKVSCWEIHLV